MSRSLVCRILKGNYRPSQVHWALFFNSLHGRHTLHPTLPSPAPMLPPRAEGEWWPRTHPKVMGGNERWTTCKLEVQASIVSSGVHGASFTKPKWKIKLVRISRQQSQGVKSQVCTLFWIWGPVGQCRLLACEASLDNCDSDKRKGGKKNLSFFCSSYCQFTWLSLSS